MREPGHAGDAAKVLAAPADEIALGIVILKLQAGPQPLNAGPPQMEVVLVAVHHARHDDLFARHDLLHGDGQFVHLAGKAAQQERLAVAHGPPLTAGIALVPIIAGARFAGPAIMKEDGGLADLRPFHGVLPLAGMEAAAADVVLDDVGWMRTLQVADLAIDDEVILLVDLLDAHDHDVGGKLDHQAETVRRLHIGVGRQRKPRQR